MALDLRGINANDVVKIQSAVREYKGRIDGVLSNITSLEASDYQKAIKGTAQESTIKKYVDDTVVQIKKITKYIDEFEQGIADVAANYLSRSGAVATGAVTEGTVEGAGELTGVQPFSE
jgi:hypothetical protein